MISLIMQYCDWKTYIKGERLWLGQSGMEKFECQYSFTSYVKHKRYDSIKVLRPSAC